MQFDSLLWVTRNQVNSKYTYIKVRFKYLYFLEQTLFLIFENLKKVKDVLN